MSELADAATRAAIVAALRTKVAELYELTRTEVTDNMDPGDRKSALLGGETVGKVVKTLGARRAWITNDAAFTRWVADNHPSEIVQAVRTSYADKILSDAKRYGQAVDVTTGELIPGVEVAHGNPYITVKLAPDAGEIIAAHWDAARHHVPELPGGGHE